MLQKPSVELAPLPKKVVAETKDRIRKGRLKELEKEKLKITEDNYDDSNELFDDQTEEEKAKVVNMSIEEYREQVNAEKKRLRFDS